MSSVDLDLKVESIANGEPATSPRISWDSAVGAAAIGFGWDAEPVVLNWFGAGEPDLLLTAAGGAAGRVARVYRPLHKREDGLPRYDAGTVVDALAGLRCVCPIPNGSASRFDLVALDAEGLVWLPNTGDGREPLFAARQALGIGANLGIGPCRIVQIVADDWDGDGTTDLLVGIDDLTDYWPDGNQVPPAQQVGFNQKGGHPGYDRNGLWRGKPPRGRLFWLRNLGKPGIPRFELQPEIAGDAGPLEAALHPAALTVAWGGGANHELLTTDARGLVQIHRNFGGQRPPVLMEARTLQCGHSALLLPDDRTTVVAADIDGDRRVELVYGSADGRVFAVHVGHSRDTAKMPVPLRHETSQVWLGGQAVLAAGDVDADGDLDIVYGDGPGRLHYLQDLGGGGDHRYAEPVAIEAGGVPFRVDPGPDGMQGGPVELRLGHASPALVDWPGNGRLSLLVGGAGGEVLYLRNDGAANSPRYGTPAPLRCQGGPLITPPRVRPAAAAWLGAELIDLIALDLQGFVCVYPRIGPMDLGPPVPIVDRLGRLIRLDGGFGEAGRCALWAGPWTGPGQIDLLVGIPRGSRYVLPALTGEPLRDLEDWPTVVLLENLGHGHVLPRPVRHADGSPVVIGVDGCSPCGVDATGRGALDLMVGADDGSITLLRRDDLRW